MRKSERDGGSAEGQERVHPTQKFQQGIKTVDDDDGGDDADDDDEDRTGYKY